MRREYCTRFWYSTHIYCGERKPHNIPFQGNIFAYALRIRKYERSVCAHTHTLNKLKCLKSVCFALCEIKTKSMSSSSRSEQYEPGKYIKKTTTTKHLHILRRVRRAVPINSFAYTPSTTTTNNYLRTKIELRFG